MVWLASLSGIAGGALGGFVVAWKTLRALDSHDLDNLGMLQIVPIALLVTVPLGILFGATSTAALTIFWVWASDAREETGA